MPYRVYTFFLLVFSISCRFQSEPADLIVHNARIYTVDENFSVAGAMAIKDGKITAVGAEREILNKYSATEKVDAMKRPVYPGFIDAHCHFLGYGESLQKIDLTGTKSFDEVIERVIKFSKSWLLSAQDRVGEEPEPAERAHPEPAERGTTLSTQNDVTSKNLQTKINRSPLSFGEGKGGEVWITGRGWDQNDWKIKQFPDKKLLDSLFPSIPVFLKRIDGHAALANAEALKRAGLNTATKISGGIIEVSNGTLTGILIDNAVDYVEKMIPAFSAEQKKKALKEAEKKCFKAGLTTVDDAGLHLSDIYLIEQMQKEGELKMRVYAMLDGNNPDSLKKYLEIKPFQSDRLNVRSFKFYADGALGSRGALLLQEYSDKKSHLGLHINSEKYLAEAAAQLYKKGFQMCTHAIGDSAVRMMLDIYSKELNGTNDKRWRIEHCQVVNPEDLIKFNRYNIIPSVQPTHATSDMYWAEERLGAERIKNAYAYKYLYEQNKLIALGTDFPVENIAPIKTFYAAVFRMDEKMYPQSRFQPGNALSVEEALKGITIFAAIANFEEAIKGSLEPGKYADFVILDTDIMTANPVELLKTKVVATFVGGEKVH